MWHWGNSTRGNSTQTEIRKVTGRLINNSFTLANEYPEQVGVAEKRGDSRITRVMPVGVFLDDDSDDAIFVGFTQDLSLEGLGVVSTKRIPPGDLVLVIGQADQRYALRAQCVQSRRISFGCYQSGLRITDILKGAQVQPLLDYFAQIEQLATNEH